MRTLSEQARTALLSGAPRYVKQVLLSRRNWNGDSYELMTPLDITAMLSECGTLKWKLDTETYGVWTLDNCTLSFSNLRNEWKEGNPSGLFPDGTLMYGSLIEIRTGVVLPDESTETLSVFRGQIKHNPVYNSADKTISLTVYGSLAALKDFSAESVSVAVENELLGSGSGTEFTTANFAAGIITAVKRGTTADGAENASALLPSSDYSISGLNAYASGAAITLKQPLLADQSLWISYKYWHTDKPIEWAAQQLCLAAGITETHISPAVFAADVKNTFRQMTAEEFDSGTDDNTDHSGGDVTAAANFVPPCEGSWAVIENPSRIICWDNSGSQVSPTLAGQCGGIWASAAQTQTLAYGTWQTTLDFTCFSYGTFEYYYHFIATGPDRTSASGYCVGFTVDSYRKLRITLYRSDGGTLVPLYSGVTTFSTPSTYSAVRAARDDEGRFSLWLSEPAAGYWHALGNVAQDSTYTTSAYQIAAFKCYQSEDVTSHPKMSGIGASGQTATGWGQYHPAVSYTSPVIDGTDSLSSWRIGASESKPAGTATRLEYQSSADNENWTAWTAVPSTGELADTNRYLRMRWNAYSDVTQTLTPTLAQWNADYYTSRIVIPVVNMTGLDCYEALCALAEMCAYEMGFDSSGCFVFRPRVSSLSACETLDETRVIETTSVSEGLDRVYNRVNVNFGEYTCVADCDSRGCARPHSQDKYGTRELTVSSGNFLPAENTDLAYAAAPTIFGFTSEKRRRATIRTAFMPWLELGDRVTLALPDSPALAPWRWGDARWRFGPGKQVYYSEADARARNMLYGLTARIDGMEFDLENYQMTLNLTEDKETS